MKILYGYFNQKTGESTVTLADKYGTYTGYAKLHPNDKANASRYTGCNIAEGRAWIKALKKQKYRETIKINTIKNLMKDININCNNLLQSNNQLNKRFNLQLKNHINNINTINDQIKFIKQQTQERLKIRNQILQQKNKV